MKEYNTAQIARDKKYMQICLELAKKGIGKVSPNPMVGCVIVKNNKIVGQGYHRYFGGAHAEIEALRRAKNKSKNATMYINLEPCVHWGKTPPCVPEIIKAGIKKVVIATKDPNPLVNGKGIRQLKVAGVKCKVETLEEEAKELNRAYIKFITKKMPYVILKSAMTLDGKIATSTGESKWITSKEARDYVHRLRSSIDAILVGVNTVLKDNPSLSIHGKGKNPKRIIIDPQLHIPLNAKIFNSTVETILITTKNIERKTNFYKKKKIRILSLPSKNGKIDFQQIMSKLAKMNIASVLIEGGGETNAYALEAGVVDEVMFFIAPKIIGGKNASTPVEGKGIVNINRAVKIKELKVHRYGRDILLCGHLG